jgi:DNA-binding NarL/FixJ family response regulator
VGKISVLLAEDHAIVRHALRRVLESDPEIEVVDEVADGLCAVESAQRLRPTVVVMDIGLPSLNGIEATSRIMRTTENVNVLMLTLHSDALYVRAGRAAGAKGYLPKDADEIELINAVKSLARGGCYFTSWESKVLVQTSTGATSGGGSERSDGQLTRSEREVLQLISEGRSHREIARILGRSLATISAHRKRLMKKLGLRDTVDMVRLATRRALTELPGEGLALTACPADAPPLAEARNG